MNKRTTLFLLLIPCAIVQAIDQQVPLLPQDQSSSSSDEQSGPEQVVPRSNDRPTPPSSVDSQSSQGFRVLQGYSDSESDNDAYGNEAVGASALFFHAATTGDTINELRQLIAHNYNPDIVDAQGRTPLMVAALNGQLEVFRILAEAGADLEAEDVQGATSLMLAMRAGRFAIVQHILNRHPQSAQQLLDSVPARLRRSGGSR